MIPFWKKIGKHSKPQSAQKRRQNAKPAVPRTAQQSIPMQRMFEDGTCRVKPNYYTRTIQYQDINYQLAQQEDRTAIFEEWCSFLNFFDSSIKFELSFVNMATDSTEFEKSIRIPFQKDGFDDVRAEYSQMLRQQLAKGNNGLTKTKFITFGVEGESMAQVKPRLDHIQNDLLNNFHRLGLQAKPLNGVQRLKLMHDMFNMDGASKFHFDWKDLVKSGLSVKDAIAPTAFAFKNSRTFQMGGIFCAASFLSITASDISDQLLKDFLDMDSSQIVTMHIQSVDQNKAIKTIKHTITELDRSKIEEQKKAVRAGYDMDVLPSDLATYGRDAKALLKELQSQNERMFLVTFLVLNTGRTEQELENNVFQASSIAQKHNCNLCRLDYQQEQGLMSSLPLADCQIEIQRGLTTSSTAIFIPFTTQELYQSGKESLYYGLNALSNNLIMVDRKKLKNPNGLILGTPGSGKSFSAKREITNAFIVTKDDIIVCDPEGEYGIKRVINNAKVSDHHAILPTKEAVEKGIADLPADKKNLMMLICQQLVQATGEEYLYEQTDITVKCQEHDFKARGKIPVQMGFKKVEKAFKQLCVKTEPVEEKEKETSIPAGYEEGMRLFPVKAEKTTHYTSPPKPFNEDTLLAAMETAGNKEFDSETEKKGLGTPATRASIIEKLVSSGYAQRKGKQILPSTEGKELVKVMPEYQKSAVMTAEWENQLLMMEKGQITDTQFMGEITSLVRKILEVCREIPEEERRRFQTAREVIGKCPVCGCDVFEGKQNF